MMQANQQINEPTLTGAVQQIHDHIALAEQRLAILRGHFWGEGESGSNRPMPTTLRGMIDDIGTRLASLCGDLATINQRVGCTPEPNMSLPTSLGLAQGIVSGSSNATQNWQPQR
jgi:hypothetical protein